MSVKDFQEVEDTGWMSVTPSLGTGNAGSTLISTCTTSIRFKMNRAGLVSCLIREGSVGTVVATGANVLYSLANVVPKSMIPTIDFNYVSCCLDIDGKVREFLINVDIFGYITMFPWGQATAGEPNVTINAPAAWAGLACFISNQQYTWSAQGPS